MLIFHKIPSNLSIIFQLAENISADKLVDVTGREYMITFLLLLVFINVYKIPSNLSIICQLVENVPADKLVDVSVSCTANGSYLSYSLEWVVLKFFLEL